VVNNARKREWSDETSIWGYKTGIASNRMKKEIKKEMKKEMKKRGKTKRGNFLQKNSRYRRLPPSRFLNVSIIGRRKEG
jgi:hypothetical protein